MEATNIVDKNSLLSRLYAARARERAARAEASRLRREMAAADRRRETQRLCVLGRALDTWAAQDERVRESARRYLSTYVVRDTDRAALAGSVWALPDVQPAPPEAGQ